MAANPKEDTAALPHHPRSSNRRTTIGFLTSNIHVGAARTVWAGVADAAQKHDVNLICLPGGSLRIPEGCEAQRNVIYDLAQIDHRDGLVSWFSAIGRALTPIEVADFHRRQYPLPIVTRASRACIRRTSLQAASARACLCWNLTSLYLRQ